MKTLFIGRNTSNDIVVDSPYVSRQHAKLNIYDSNKISIVDLNSAGGTFVNGRKINSEFFLKSNDLVRLSQVEFNWKQYITNIESSFVRQQRNTNYKKTRIQDNTQQKQFERNRNNEKKSYFEQKKSPDINFDRILSEYQQNYVSRTWWSYFVESLTKMFVFSGRARRLEVLSYGLFSFMFFYIPVIIVFEVYFNKNSIYINRIFYLFLIFIVVYYLSFLPVLIRRMHDTGRSGWYVLFPIYNLVLFLTDGDFGTNKYGDDPRIIN